MNHEDRVKDRLVDYESTQRGYVTELNTVNGGECLSAMNAQPRSTLFFDHFRVLSGTQMPRYYNV